MGWTCYQKSRDAVVESELRDHGTNRRGFRVLKRKWDGWNRLWVLCEAWYPGEALDEAPVVKRFIGVLLLKSYPQHGEWCAKFVSDDMGPSEVAAPLAWLDHVTVDSESEFAGPWYDRVRAYHQRRGTGRKLQVGMTVPVAAGGVATITSLKPLRGIYAGHLACIQRSQIVWAEMS